jgi:hypothetical protein
MKTHYHMPIHKLVSAGDELTVTRYPSETDVRRQIAMLGNGVTNSEDVRELRSLVSRLLVMLERSGAAQKAP